MEKKPSAWPERLIELAKEFNAAEQTAEMGSWRAARVASELRKEFKQKARKGEPGWTEFCVEMLGRNYKTVNSYVRAADYCDAEVPDWRERIGKDGEDALPPIALVAELAAREETPEREALHRRLFSGDWPSTDEFRRSLRALALAEDGLPDDEDDEPGGGEGNPPKRPPLEEEYKAAGLGDPGGPTTPPNPVVVPEGNEVALEIPEQLSFRAAISFPAFVEAIEQAYATSGEVKITIRGAGRQEEQA